MLHNLSFIEDPTRIFRAVRYENRYGFRMDEQTKGFAKSCVDMHLVGDLSSVRLRDELIPLLSEADVEWTLGRLFELGVAREVHPKLATGTKTVALVRKLDALVEELGLQGRSGKLAATAGGRHPQHGPRRALHVARQAQAQAQRQRGDPARGGGRAAARRSAGQDGHDRLGDLPGAAEDLRGGRGVRDRRLSRSARRGDRLRRYLADIRHRTLSVGGSDLLAMGMKRDPAVGRILERLKEMRVEGVIEGREAELEAAQAVGGGRPVNDRWVTSSCTLIPVLLFSMTAPRTGAWVGRLPAGRPDREEARAPEPQPHQAPGSAGHAMFFITYLFSGIHLRLGQADTRLPVLLQEPTEGHGASWASAGPLTNFMLAIIFALVLNSVTPDARQPTCARLFTLLFLLFQVNVVLGIFNLIPIPPLDGSRVVGGFLPRGAYEKWVAVDRYGMFVIIVLIVLFRAPFFRILDGGYDGAGRALAAYVHHSSERAAVHRERR